MLTILYEIFCKLYNVVIKTTSQKKKIFFMTINTTIISAIIITDIKNKKS